MNKPKQPDVLETLGKAAGIDRQATLKLWEEVKANHAKLDGCPKHDFKLINKQPLSARHRCTACGGEIDGTAYHWYSLGLKHGASQP